MAPPGALFTARNAVAVFTFGAQPVICPPSDEKRKRAGPVDFAPVGVVPVTTKSMPPLYTIPVGLPAVSPGAGGMVTTSGMGLPVPS